MSDRARRIVERSARVLFVAATAVALVVGVCAFLDGTEPRSLAIAIVLFLVPLIAPGLLVWRRPQAKSIWAWTVIGWIAGIAYIFFLADERMTSPELLPAFRVVEIGSLVAAGLVMFGAPLLGFAMMAASAAPGGAPHALARRLRRFIKLVVPLGAVIAAFGFLPGTRVYDDSRNCFGNALGAMFTEAHSSGCRPSYDQLTATRLAGGIPLLLYMLLVLAPAIVVHVDPRARRAWLWILWSFVAVVPAGAMFFVLEFHLDFFSHTETLWPARVVEAGIVALLLLLTMALPILTLVTREPVRR